jgi:hypothetical protein
MTEARMKIYLAETGQLEEVYTFKRKDKKWLSIKESDSNEGFGKTNKKIKEDRAARLLFRYHPDGYIGYFFYASTDVGRPKQYIAEFEMLSDWKKEMSEDRLVGVFIDLLNYTLGDAGYELYTDERESELLRQKGNEDGLLKTQKEASQEIDNEWISPEAEEALDGNSSTTELGAPDIETALRLFWTLGDDTSIVISDGGRLEHREHSGVFIKIESLRNKVEPIGQTKEKINTELADSAEERSKEELKKLVSNVGEDACEISDRLTRAGFEDKLDSDVYCRQRGEKKERKLTDISGGAVLVLFAAYTAVFQRSVIYNAVTQTVSLGEPLVRRVRIPQVDFSVPFFGYLDLLGPYNLGPYTFQSYWFLMLGFILIGGAVLSRNGTAASSHEDPRSPPSKDNETAVSDRKDPKLSPSKNVDVLIESLEEIKNRSKNDNRVRELVDNRTPFDLYIGEKGSKTSFHRKKALTGILKGAMVASVIVLMLVILVLWQVWYLWEILLQMVLLVAVLVLLLEVVAASRIIKRATLRKMGSATENLRKENGEKRKRDQDETSVGETHNFGKSTEERSKKELNERVDKDGDMGVDIIDEGDQDGEKRDERGEKERTGGDTGRSVSDRSEPGELDKKEVEETDNLKILLVYIGMLVLLILATAGLVLLLIV